MAVTQSYVETGYSPVFNLEQKRAVYRPKDDLPVLVGMDFNGLIADKPKLKSAIVSEMFDTYIAPENCNSDYIRELFGAHKHLSKLLCRYRKETEHLLQHPKFIEQAKPVSGAIENIEYLLDRGGQLGIVTSEGDTQANVRAIHEWFEEYMGCIPFSALSLTDHKPKFHYCRMQNIGAFVDNELPKARESGAPLTYVIDVHGTNHRSDVWVSWHNEYGVPRVAQMLRDLDVHMAVQPKKRRLFA